MSNIIKAELLEEDVIRFNGEEYYKDPGDVEHLAEALQASCNELSRAIKKFPEWPSDPFHALAVLQEEVGELAQALLQHNYEVDKKNKDDIHTEAVQVSAMALRFLLSLHEYRHVPSEQHKQNIKSVI